MIKDDERIAILYENLHKIDYLKLDESQAKSYNWHDLFHNKLMTIHSSLVLEDFEKIEDQKTTDDGDEDVYKITLKNGSIFDLIISYSKPSSSDRAIKQKIIYTSHQSKASNNISSDYEKYFENMSPDEFIVLLLFSDSKGRHNITGEVGASTVELFNALRSGIMDSFWSHNRYPKLKSIMMRVSKQESRRMELYKAFAKRYLPDYANNMFVDGLSEGDYDLLVMVRD